LEYISSDANIWLDFNTISKIDIPFRLRCTYLMYNEALREEILQPPELLTKLQELGLIGTELTLEEFYYADELSNKYKKLSGYDRTALAIAKHRGIALLTGDEALRKAAQKENVYVFGTIGLLDKLYNEYHIDEKEFRCCLEGFLEHKERRLPVEEIQKRINSLMDKN